ncbi:hypothetical protein EV401DRAFT_1890177 [Pisolithus croceorrhizus]|nr:hypothetical protein EV401DRAFT_1890177 [Pisolithus croceorrhizus]
MKTPHSDSEDDWQPPLVIDSLKLIVDKELDNDLEPSAQDVNFQFPDISDNETYTCLINLAIRTRDNPSDETWLPASRARQKKKSAGRPMEYKKGPDIGSKSAHTKQHYQKLLQNQTSLTSFGFVHIPWSPSPSPSSDASPIPSSPLCTPDPPVKVPEQPFFPSNDGLQIQSDSNYTTGMSGDSREADLAEYDVGLVQGMEDAWEEELEEQEHGGVEVWGWDELWNQIKEDLAKGAKTLPLWHINQLLLICNFATLWLQGIRQIKASLEIAHQWDEGEVRALSCHYQIFEQLPTEKRGGQMNALSPLKDERIQLVACHWLTSQAAGQITPKLGWQKTKLKKGVYMDGHEHEDVKKYWQEVFLPMMATFESHMVHFEGPELQCMEPTLAAGQKKVIANFHDECCFHASDFKTHV